jgi:hypothetical protein
MDKETRNAIERATQKSRRLLEEDFAEQLDGVFDVRGDGRIASKGGAHLTGRQHLLRDKIVAAIDHKLSVGIRPEEAVSDYVRDAAFTALNRFAALKMLEARDLVQECVSRGDASSGFAEFCGLAPALRTADGTGYRLYIESIFDELSTEVKVLFDRRDPASVLWPTKPAFDDLLAILNHDDLTGIWAEDETIGWVYQFFNSGEERRLMREASTAPRTSRELAVRNQFFTPSYIVQFLSDNSLGRIWYEMRKGNTALRDICDFLVAQPDEPFLRAGPDSASSPSRPKRDPRSITALDPACGSGHFLLYLFTLLLVMYEEAWNDPESPAFDETGQTLREDYPTIELLQRQLPGLILKHNLFGLDIDPRCAQIAQLALWIRAQRAFKDFRVTRIDRPVIRRANIVIAEPIPGDRKLVDDFAAGLEPALLGDLFKEIVAEMRSAGELGALLSIDRKLASSIERARKAFVEHQNRQAFLPGLSLGQSGRDLDVSGIDGLAFFEQAETQLFASLQKFVSEGVNGIGVRRRLFADDAKQGIAFVELMLMRFDVLVMNPPFGDTTPTAVAYLEENYHATRLDLFAAFCQQMLNLSKPGGLVGAITPRDGFFKKTLIGWRELVLNNHMPLVADLGLGVLDGATVRVAAYILGAGTSRNPSLFFDVLDLPDREARLRAEIGTPKKYFSVSLESFRTLPLSRFLYWLPTRLWEIYHDADPLENVACTPRYGLATFDDERFCRLSFEVPTASIGRDRLWAFMSKGGDDYPYGGVSSAVVKWENDAAEMAEVNRRSNGQVAQTRRASRFYFQPAISFSNRSVQFSVRWHPANFVFSMRGPAVIPISASQAYLMGFFNSRLIRTLIQMQTASQTYTTGVLKELRWVEPDEHTRLTVEEAASEVFALIRLGLSTVETDPFFAGAFAGVSNNCRQGVSEYFVWRSRFVDELNEALPKLQLKIDDAIARLYGVSTGDIERCERSDDDDAPYAEFPPRFAFPQNEAETLVSYLWGIAIHRWQMKSDVRLPQLNDAAPLSPPGSAQRTDQISIVVEDPGHPLDIVALVEAELIAMFPNQAEERLVHLEQRLGTSLRQWVGRSFFGKHLAAYSAFGRSAPLYWQLGTPSGLYSAWLFFHAVTKDTLFRVQDEFVAPKLAHEQRQLNSMRADSGSETVAKQQKAVEDQVKLVADVQSLLDEVKRVAPLWRPFPEDGVILNAAPLWRLFPQNRPWQREIKTCWDELCAGTFDWSHVAMHLWPERVVPKCSEDRSLAIAHGIESSLWVENEDGKWCAIKNPQPTIEEMVRARTSPAVKASLKSLLEAPDVAGGTKRVRKSRAA